MEKMVGVVEVIVVMMREMEGGGEMVERGRWAIELGHFGCTFYLSPV